VGQGRILVWETADGRVRHDFPAVNDMGGTSAYDRVCFSRDGSLLGTVRGLEAYVYDLRTGRVSSPKFAARGYRNNVWFTEADTLFVTGGEDQIDARPLAERDQPPPSTPRKFPQTPRHVRGVWEQADGDRGLLTVLVGDGLVRQYFASFARDAFPDLKSARQPGDPIPIPFSFPTAVAAFGVSPGGRTWAVGDAAGTITVFPASTPTDLGLSVPHPGGGAVYGVGFVAGGGIVSQAQNLSVAAGPPGQPPVWARTTPRPDGAVDLYAVLRPAAGLTSSPDGRLVAYRLPANVPDPLTGKPRSWCMPTLPGPSCSPLKPGSPQQPRW
jgi:hypothetical protein